MHTYKYGEKATQTKNSEQVYMPLSNNGK